MTGNLPMATILTEIDAIDTVMRTDRAAYNRDVGMQARYRSLIEQKHGGGASIVGQEDNAPLVQMLSPKEYAAECSRQGIRQTYDAYMRQVRAIADVALAIPEPRSFVSSFDRLPEAVQVACVRNALGPAPMVNPTSDETMVKFAQEAEGAVLTREWGHLAARNHARCRARIAAVIDELDGQFAQTFVDWLFVTLSDSQRTALYRKLAA